MPIHGKVEGRWSSSGLKPPKPTPESLALVKSIFDDFGCDFGDREESPEIARRIDAHVAERTLEFPKDRTAAGYRSAWKAMKADRDALRAAADAMAETLEEFLSRWYLGATETPRLKEALAAYRALSPAGEEK